MPMLDLNDWTYQDYFLPLPDGGLHPVIARIEEYITAIDFRALPFFQLARTSKLALELWVTQELVMTNAFSQLVLRAASEIKNVHLRAVLCEVATGEHGRVRRGIARRSHPWLLNELRESIDLDMRRVMPIGATATFLRALEETTSNPLEAIAAIGVGNERLIVPEYESVKECFALVWPEALHEPFLNANIDEDVVHARLCYEAASRLIAAGADPDDFDRAARSSIDNRLLYFAELHAHASRLSA